MLSKQSHRILSSWTCHIFLDHHFWWQAKQPAGRVSGRTSTRARSHNVLGADSVQSFQPSCFSITSRFPCVSGGFLERFGSLERMEMEGTLRNVLFPRTPALRPIRRPVPTARVPEDEAVLGIFKETTGWMVFFSGHSLIP